MNAGPPKDWLLWQIADSGFPAGGFAHSGGLEATVQLGEVRNREQLRQFMDAAIAQSASNSLPFVAAGWDGEPALDRVDELYDAFTSNHVANRASRLQGQAFLSSADRAFNQPELTALRSQAKQSPSHFAPIFGAVARQLGFEKEASLRLYLFTQIRGWLSSAVRLNIIGPIEAQALQAALPSSAETAIRRCASLEDAAQTAPLLDLFQGCQDRLYSRLFQS